MSDTDYLLLLTNGYIASNQLGCASTPYSYLCDEIFDVWTYDCELSDKMGPKIMGVINAITNKTTWDLVNDENTYEDYIMICHLPFIASKIEWGGSIRGAWWCHEDIPIHSCGLIDGDGNQVLDLRLNSAEWIEFLDAINIFLETLTP